MFKLIEKSLNRIDLFKTAPFILINKKSKVSTKLSQTLSFVLIIIAIQQIVFSLLAFFKFENINIAETYSNIDINAVQTINSKNIMFAL